MPFSSLLFLSVFLPTFLGLYWTGPRVLRNGVALAFSLLFYAWGAPRLLPVVLMLGVLDYYLGHAIWRVRQQVTHASESGEESRLAGRGRRLLVLGVIVHLSILGYFKYSNFLVGQTNDLLALLPGAARIPWTEVALPIGISFLTFEEISYLVDISRGHARPARSIGNYLLFLMLFPHSIAGPIFRWKDLEDQLTDRPHSLNLVVSGAGRFVFGLSKKVLVADAVATAVDPVFAAAPGTVPTAMAWLAACAYAIQIYFDFSGYSDMAIGLGRMIGFQFKENFEAPYRAASITEFWRRWHLSLSNWLRDYLYVALGGNRHGERRTRINVLLVFALSGLWHGAAWTFVAWGAFHGVLVVAERTPLVRRVKAALPRAINVAITLLLVVIGWVFFRAPSFASAVALLKAMFRVGPIVETSTLYWGQLMTARSAMLFVVAVACSVVAPFAIPETSAARSRLRTIGLWLAPMALVLVLAQLVNSGFSPLIYFKF